MEILKDKEMVDLLGVVHKTILPFYECYADRDHLVNKDAVSRFLQDFGVFPDYVTWWKLDRYFLALSTFFDV